jgi:hypothetical protein
LNTLEIVRKTTIVVWLYLDGLNSLVSNIQLINVLGIFLKEVNHLDGWSRVSVATHIKYWSL